MGLCVVLHGLRSPSIGIALTQHRVDRTALDPVIASSEITVGIADYGVWIVRQGIALVLQLLDRGLKLRDGGRDIGQLDDIGRWRLRQGTQLGQRIASSLRLWQEIAERRDDPTGKRDVPSLHIDSSHGGIGRDDWQK